MRLRKVLFGALFLASFVILLQGIVLFLRNDYSYKGICNDAGPFGLPLPSFLLIAGFLVASVFFLLRWWQETDRVNTVLWLVLLASGGSNFVERLAFGCVYDYVSIGFFPMFNLADVLLTVSVVFLGWREIRKN